MRYLKKNLIFILLCIGLINRAMYSAQVSCRLDFNDNNYLEKLNNFLPEPFVVQSVQYTVDGSYDQHELDYLIGFSVGALVSVKDVFNALFYLQQSIKFTPVQLELIRQSDDRIVLQFTLLKNQILTGMRVKGFLRGKELLKNHYLIDMGDLFDIQKHQHSLVGMADYLKNQGYLSANIQDFVEIDPVSKNVVVRCLVHKGSKFKISKTEVVFDQVGTVDWQEIVSLQQRLEKTIRMKLLNKDYCWQLVADQIKKIKEFLSYHGCIDFDVNILKFVDEKNRQVALKCVINLERKREFVFSGSSFFTHEQIIQHLLLYGKSTWHFPSSLIVDEIEQLYKNKGFWNVKVSVREEKDRVFCFIQEGSRALISSILFNNNDQLSPSYITNEASFSKIKNKHFDKDLYKNFCAQIIKVYKRHGFWDAKIIKEQFVPSVKSHHYQLVLTMHEGVQRFLNSVDVVGHDELLKYLKILSTPYIGKCFDQAMLQEQRQSIIKFLKNQCSSGFVLNYSLKEHAGMVDVVWTVELKDLSVKIGKTIIVGNAQVAHRLLMQEISYDYADRWNKKNIEKSLQNFKTLPIFESVQMYPGHNPDANDCKPIFVKLIQDDRYEVRTRFGLQQVGRNLQFHRGFTYKVGATLCLKNPFHYADQMLLEGDATKFYHNVAAIYDFPWLFGKKIESQFKFYDNAYQQPVYIGSQDGLYNATQQGFLFSVNHTRNNKRLGEFLLNGSAGIEFMGLFEAEQPNLGSIIDYDSSLLGKKIGYLFMQPTVLWQSVDNLLNPSTGHMSFLSCKAMFDFDSKTSFFKVLFEHSLYFSMGQQATVALRGRLGHLFNRCFDQINPIERFYLGGACTLRGYERDYCPPYGTLTKPIYDQHAGLPACANDIWRYAPQGGRSMFNLNAEIRFNVYKNIGVVIFNDFGALFKDSMYNELVSWRDNFFAGSGFGFRYNTPIGPARFDVGWKWKHQYPDFEARCVWYLTLGQAF